MSTVTNSDANRAAAARALVYKGGFSQSAEAPSRLRTFVSKRAEHAEKGEAPELNADLARKYNNLGDDAFRQGHFSEAIDHYNEALKYNPNFVEAHRSLGLALFKQNNLEEAAVHFSEVLRLNPTDAFAREKLNAILTKQKELKGTSAATG